MRKVKKNFKSLLLIAVIFLPVISYSQTIDFGAIEEQAATAADTIKYVAQVLLGSLLSVGVVFVVYTVLTQSERTKQAIVGFVTVLVITAIAWALGLFS